MANNQCKIVAIEHLTLDGVYQAPARPDEDTRNGFNQGGWSKAGDDHKMNEVIGKYMADGWTLLAGSATYADLYEGWQVRQPTNPMTKALANIQKFVVTNNPALKLPWENSLLLTGEATETVAKLKKEHDKTLIIFGSGVLIRSLMQRGLIDEFLLMIHPIVLGKGRRLFDNAAPLTQFKLIDEVATGTGVIIATYQLAPV